MYSDFNVELIYRGIVIQLEKKESIYLLTMDAEENRWNTTFVREISKALDEIENDEGPGALITSSTNPKFFSHGLDLDWMQSPENHPEGGDKEVFGEEFMYLMGRFITLPIPTICAINGHAFGAGFMFALSHDVRIMREDRGFLCANEMQLGLPIPRPELALFKHKVPANTFFETVQLSKRWTGLKALEAGIIQGLSSFEMLQEEVLKKQKNWHLLRKAEKTLVIKKRCYTERMQPLILIMDRRTC